MLCALSAFAESADALKELSATHDFAFGGVGVAGITSKGEIAFRQVLASPSSEKDFLDLLATGNAQARCYALVALHVLDPKRYVERVLSSNTIKAK